MKYIIRMAKKRTRKQKIRISRRASRSDSFEVNFSAIDGVKNKNKIDKKQGFEAEYFRADLTKVAVLTMLALASEMALWFYLKR